MARLARPAKTLEWRRHPRRAKPTLTRSLIPGPTFPADTKEVQARLMNRSRLSASIQSSPQSI